jgi:anti-anti-sigma regulatory factor
MKQNKRKRKIAPAAQPAAPTASTPPAKSSAASASLALGASCTIREGAVLKAELLKLANAEHTVVLDVQAVERVDTAALQLLCAFVRDRRAQGRRTNWTGNPQSFTDAVEVLGLTQALGYVVESSV